MRKSIPLLFLLGIIVIYGFASEAQHHSCKNLTGVFWGAFDPPTEAHAAIIATSLQEIPLKRLIIVVNNNSYKNYTFPLEERMHLIEEILRSKGLDNVQLLSQDDAHKIDCFALKKTIQGPLCAIAGYDAYKTWVKYSSSEERSLYDAIAVIPRGDDPPTLFDAAAFILPIHPMYKFMSSSQVRQSFSPN